MTKLSRGNWPGFAFAAAAVLALVVAAIFAGCGSSSSASDGEVSFTGSGYPGVDASNTRNPESEIDSSNVTGLSEAWKAPIRGESNFGSYASTPVIDKGVIYSQDLASNV
jgi:hypothetical protein